MVTPLTLRTTPKFRQNESFPKPRLHRPDQGTVVERPAFEEVS